MSRDLLSEKPKLANQNTEATNGRTDRLSVVCFFPSLSLLLPSHSRFFLSSTHFSRTLSIINDQFFTRKSVFAFHLAQTNYPKHPLIRSRDFTGRTKVTRPIKVKIVKSCLQLLKRPISKQST